MLIGREQDVSRLTALIDETPLAPGHLHLVQLNGDVGVGKSALVSTVINKLQERDASDGDSAQQRTPPRSCFLAHGDHLHASAPLTAFRSLIESSVGASLEQLLETDTPARLARRCHAGLGRGPVLIVVDDAQWLGPTSLLFLESLIRHPAQGPVTVLAVHRAGHDPHELIRAARQRGAKHDIHTVLPLSDCAVAQLAADLPAHQRAAVIESVAGNPLFASTVIAAFRRCPEASQVSDVLSVTNETQQSPLSSVISSDLDALDEATRCALETLAVLGRADDAAVGEVTGLDNREVRTRIDELVDRGLLAERPYGALHPVIRMSVYQNTDAERRAEIHRRAARLPNVELFDRADHLAGAVNNATSIAQQPTPITEGEAEVLVEASAVAVGSEPSAALRWLENMPTPVRSVESETLLARAMLLVGDVEPAIEVLRTITSKNDDAEAYVLLANALRLTERAGEARAVLASAYRATKDENPRLLLEYIDVIALVDGSAPEELLSRLESLPVTSSSSTSLNRAVAAIYRTMTLLAEGRVPQARVTFQRVIEWVDGVTNEDLSRVLHAAACAAWAAYILDHFELGARFAQRTLELSHLHGQADVFANLGTALSFCRASLGMLDEAEEAGEQAIRDAEVYGPSSLIGMARAGLMLVAQGRGDRAVLQLRYDDLLAAPVPEFGWWRRAVLTTRTRVSAMLGQPAACPELLGEPRDAMAALRYADAAAVSAALGEPQTAKKLLTEGLRIAEKQEQAGQRAMVLTTEAEILLRGGDPLQAANLFRAASEIFDRHGMRLQLGRAQSGLARAETALHEWSAPLSQLTAREQEVAELVAQGLKNREIASRLTLSTSTAENHVRNVLKKLGLTSRGEVAGLLASPRGSSPSAK